MAVALHRKSCCPAGASVLISSSLDATQVAGVAAMVTARTGSVAPAPLKSCVPAEKVLEAAIFAAAADRPSMLDCRLVSAVNRVPVSLLILFCNELSAAWRAEVSAVSPLLLARSAGVNP